MQDLLQSINPSSISDLSVVERQRARLQWQQSFEPMDETNNNLSFDTLLSLPNSLKAPRADLHTLLEMGNGLHSKKEETSKKRKVAKSPTLVACVDRAEREKKMKAASSPGNSKETGARPPAPKQDFIHVRARRGQATDSHSLAERVRRERISERMKYLQGLVPGCNKITGKAGMLDEIINYVQSLQRQVEFLSMKLATANPWIEFSIDSFFPKEVNFACNPSINMSQVEVSPEMVEPYLPMAAFCGLNTNTNVSELDPTLRRTLGSTVSIPDEFFDSSFNVDNYSWDENSESICGLDFHQGKGAMLALHSMLGSSPPNNLKMEM